MSAQEAARIAARLDRLPLCEAIWHPVLYISLGGVFEFYSVFLTAYIAPRMVDAGLFTPASLGPFAALRDIAVSGAGTFVFCTFAGLWAGAVLGAPLVDYCGRKRVFFWSLLWYSACTAIMACQQSGAALNLWRFIAGIGFGAELVAMDTYIAELIPGFARGRAFALNQTITFTIVPFAALLAWLTPTQILPALPGWRLVMLVGAAGALVAWPLWRLLPESPRWLALKGRTAQAEAVMQELETAAQRAAPLPAPAIAQPEAEGRGTLWEMFTPRYIERTLMLSLFNIAQVVGFYGFAAWVPALLIARGITIVDSFEYSFIIALANPFGPALGLMLADRLERRTQIVLGLGLMALFMAAFSIARAPFLLILIGVMFTLAANLMSYAYHGYQAELYPTRIRGRAIGFTYGWSRMAAAFAGLAVGYFLYAGGVPAVALFIGVAMLVGMVMITVFGPDSAGLPLEEINH
ncbi:MULTISPECIES: MFS transporter [unclassified Acidocella]|uniref:MFS transporter n=1 Tax=unclassified Acidocella TaxID=2648610 RepID=UPI000587A34B|nr:MULTISPECIES: MFS transporter [unclassified Acidocella]WBO59562.1 MFS transporter [Acidocella sp. MX-AZ03]